MGSRDAFVQRRLMYRNSPMIVGDTRGDYEGCVEFWLISFGCCGLRSVCMFLPVHVGSST